jgi:hypothetical protein
LLTLWRQYKYRDISQSAVLKSLFFTPTIIDPRTLDLNHYLSPLNQQCPAKLAENPSLARLLVVKQHRHHNRVQPKPVSSSPSVVSIVF